VLNTTISADLNRPGIKIITRDLLLPRNYRELSDDFTNPAIKVPTTVVRIDNYVWVTLPVELFHEIGKRIKAISCSPFTYVVTYCNGSLGYLPTQKAFSEGGYEPSGTHFDPISEQVLIKEIKNMLAETF
jgi:hypothetical protein